MELNNLALAYLVEELKPLLVGAFINKVQEVKKGVFKFRLRTKEGSRDFMVFPQAFYLTEFKVKAPKLPHGYSIYLRKHLLNQKIQALEQHYFDRIVRLELDDFILVFEFFGEGNIILLNKENEIVMPFKREKWKDREIKKNVLYEFPPMKKTSPLTVKPEELSQALKESQKNVFSTILGQVNIAPVYLEELFQSLKIKAEEKKLSQKNLEKLTEKIKALYTVDLKKLQPNTVRHKGKEELVPVKLSYFKPVKSFKGLNQALDEILSQPLLKAEAKEAREKIEAEISQLEFNLKQVLEAEKKLKKQALEQKKKAEWIYAHYPQLQELMESLRKALKQKLSQKEVMYKLHLAEEKKLVPKGLVEKIDLKKKKLYLKID